MKKYTIHIIFAIVIIVLAVVIGCKYFNKQDSSVSSNSVATAEPVATATPEPTLTVEPTAEPTEAPHEHVYTETVTTEATCEADGLKTFACECGDSYTEVITATGHVFENYIYNEDATYLADGTQTATCVCCLTDTQTAFGSKLEYTYTYMDAVMYAQQTVNVRDMPCTDGEKIDSLSTNEEVTVLAQCNETGWYKVYHESFLVGFVSDSYLGTSKVIVSNNGGGSTTQESYNDIPPGAIPGQRPGEYSPDLEANDAAAGDGGDIVGPDINWNTSSSGGSGGNGNGNAFDGWGNNEGNDGGDLVTDGTLNP